MIALDHRTYVCHLLDGMRRRLSVNGLPEGAGQQVDQQQASVKTNQPAIRLVLSAIESIAQFTTAWNLTAPGRRSMSIRLGPEVFQGLSDAELPFAAFYVAGNGFDGFHVRFEDVARGGMRLVTTRDQEHFLTESVHTLEEAYSLAAAQQLKNKDIAEGGAKATILLQPGVNPDRAGRDFIDGLLDLIIGQGGEDAELLYLGPDENVSPELIDWIVERSAERGYPFPNTIMSSKPRSGVNHKEFGVTSEGVTAFLKHALRHAGIDSERDSFSVKLTGGPDGDVAGNGIKILIREFAERVKFVGLADGSGSAVDPKGLAHDELLRLVDQQLPIASFDKSRLSPQGSVSGLVTRMDVERRNDLQFSVQSDVFIPAGGRPFTINHSNWTAYFDDNGLPMARIIIEGANLFVQDAAHKNLSDRGVLIVRDSSANKCGVICSSLEIISGMLLSEDEFMRIKTVFVHEVLALLRRLADIEATCLFNEKERLHDVSLPELSVLISHQILRLGNIIHAGIAAWTWEDNELANQMVLHYLPDSLVRACGTGLVERIPVSYRNQLVAAILSSQITYREGHQHLRQMSDLDLEKLALRYLRLDPRTEEMIRQVAATDILDADRIVKILRYAGSKAQRELGL